MPGIGQARAAIRRGFGAIAGIAVLALLGVVPAAVKGAGPSLEKPDPFASFVALDAQALSELRGGFITPEGLELNIGLDRAVLVNGELQSSWSLRFDDLQALTRQRDLMAIVDGPGMGDGGRAVDTARMLGDLQRAGILDLLQNRMDNQVIQNITRLDIRARGLGDGSNPGLGRMISSGIVDGLR